MRALLVRASPAGPGEGRPPFLWTLRRTSWGRTTRQRLTARPTPQFRHGMGEQFFYVAPALLRPSWPPLYLLRLLSRWQWISARGCLSPVSAASVLLSGRFLVKGCSELLPS
ncbi:unnamed protein product [Urochloa humidicola]